MSNGLPFSKPFLQGVEPLHSWKILDLLARCQCFVLKGQFPCASDTHLCRQGHCPQARTSQRSASRAPRSARRASDVQTEATRTLRESEQRSSRGRDALKRTTPHTHSQASAHVHSSNRTCTVAYTKRRPKECTLPKREHMSLGTTALAYPILPCRTRGVILSAAGAASSKIVRERLTYLKRIPHTEVEARLRKKKDSLNGSSLLNTRSDTLRDSVPATLCGSLTVPLSPDYTVAVWSAGGSRSYEVF